MTSVASVMSFSGQNNPKTIDFLAPINYFNRHINFNHFQMRAIKAGEKIIGVVSDPEEDGGGVG